MATKMLTPKFASGASLEHLGFEYRAFDGSELDTVMRAGADATYLFVYMIRHQSNLKGMENDNIREYLLGSEKPWSKRRYRMALDAMADALLADRFAELTIISGLSTAGAVKTLKIQGWPDKDPAFYRALAKANKADMAELQRTMREATSPDGELYGMRD